VDVVAWAFIMIGTLSAAGRLATLTIGRPRYSPKNLHLSLFVVAAGSCILAIQSGNEIAKYCAAAVLTAVVAWIFVPRRQIR
jgi:hypothetical protein